MQPKFASHQTINMPSLASRYISSMLLSAAGDALGYRNARWEFCFSGAQIHKELTEMGGLGCVCLTAPKWKVSDDTVMHLATGEALIKQRDTHNTEELLKQLAISYKLSMDDMLGRAPGDTSSLACYFNPNHPETYKRSFNPRGGGCGAAMRAMCIGLRFPRPEELSDLIRVSVEAGRITHNNPVGYLGSFVSALFNSFAIQGKPLKSWGAAMIGLLPEVWKYIESSGRDVQENKEEWKLFVSKWQDYLTLRGISDGQSEPKFPAVFGVEERDVFYHSLSLRGWGGASGHDSTIIAYDALLGANGDWGELCMRGMLHGGDNDSTGAIAGAWFGALYELSGVEKCHYQFLEYKMRLADLAVEIFRISHPHEPIDTGDIELAPSMMVMKSVNYGDVSDGEGECGEHSKRDSSDDES